MPNPKPQESTHQVPRNWGREQERNILADNGNNPVMSAAAVFPTMGAQLLSALMDRYKPVMKGNDIDLPGTGPIDPRLYGGK